MRILFTLWVSAPWMIPSAQSQLAIDSFAWTTNGPRISWTDSATNQGYTVQVKGTLPNSDWRNVATRYRWPWPFTQWGDVPRKPAGSQLYRVVAQPISTPNRGKLLTSSLKAQYTVSELVEAFSTEGREVVQRPKFGAVARSYQYETVDPYGIPILASAMLMYPRGTNGPLPLASVQHGTLALKSEAPSQPRGGFSWAVALASQGYAVVVPDYLGLGNSPGYQAYTHAKSEATCVVDALRAGRALCSSNKLTLNGKLFLTGYSQGGHVTMAAHRELEAFHADEFTVTASAPSAGPYDLGGAMIENVIANPPYAGGPFFAIMLASYLPIYRLGNTLEELLEEPSRSSLPATLDGTHGFEQMTAAMPTDCVGILRADFQSDFRTNVSNPLRRALIENNTHAWTPKAPLRMFHCRGDEIVNFANAEVAYHSFTNRGACCVSVVDPGAPESLNHDQCLYPNLRDVIAWFQTFPQ